MKEALELALNALEAMQMYAAAEHKGLLIICDEAITAIKAALAQPAQQDPSSGYSARMLVYTTPPQRTWVGLTRMELIKCGVLPYGMSYKLYEAIKAKLKEKNT